MKENNEKEKQPGSNNEEEEVFILKEKIKFLESVNNFLKSDISIKQKVKDSILNTTTTYWIINVVEYRKTLTIKSIKREEKTKNVKNKNRDSNRNSNNFTARKQNDQRSQNENQDEVRDNKTSKKEIVIIGDFMIKFRHPV